MQLTHRSDAGSHYASYSFQQAPDGHDVLQSIGSVGDAYENAMAESFLDRCKTELIADRLWHTPRPTRAGDRATGPPG